MQFIDVTAPRASTKSAYPFELIGTAEDVRKRGWSSHQRRPAYYYALFLQDMLIATGCLASLFQRTISPGRFFPYPDGTLHSFIIIFVLLYAGMMCMVYHNIGLYKINVIASYVYHARHLLKGVIFSITMLAMGIFILSFTDIVRPDLPAIRDGLVIYLTMFVIARLISQTAFRSLMERGICVRSVVILGSGSIGKRLAANLTDDWSYGLRVTGFLDDESLVGTVITRGVPVIGRVSDVERIVNERRIDEIVVCLEHYPTKQLLQIADLCSQTAALLYVASAVYGAVHKRNQLSQYGDVPVVGVGNLRSAVYEGHLKRLVDITGSALGLVLLFPLFLLIAAAIKLESEGPVFYRQIRVGKKGKKFKFYKFRSMYLGSDLDPSREHHYAGLIKGKWNGTDAETPAKIVDEAKITRVGRIIRKTSLDELPQLLHVLTGEMSLVGPRPCLPYEWKYYEDWHKKRLRVTAGCTGVWQVMGRSKVGFEEMVILDVFYSQNISFHFDLWLICRTIPTMIFGRGGK